MSHDLLGENVALNKSWLLNQDQSSSSNSAAMFDSRIATFDPISYC